MNKTSIQNFMAKSSLFKGPNHKLVSSYTPPISKINPSASKQPTPTRSQFTPPNPLNFKVKQKLLCKSCHDKKGDGRRQESLKLDELEGVERDLQVREKGGASASGKGNQYENAYLESGRPGSFIYGTVQISHPVKISQFQRSPPAFEVNSTSPRVVDRFQQPITEEENIEESAQREVTNRQPKKSSNSRPQNQVVNILIDNQSPTNRRPNQANLYRTSLSNKKGESEGSNLRPQSTEYPFKMAKTESNYFKDSFVKQESPNYIKQSNKGCQAKPEEVPMTRSSIIKIQNNSKNNHNVKESSNNFQRIVPASSITSNSYLRDTAGRDGNAGKEYFNERQNFFNSTKRDTNRYIDSIRFKLKESCDSLEIIEAEIDVLIEKNLDLECQKIKSSLYKVIDIQLKEFVQSERHKLSATKFSYMSDLYEIKCNIDLRLQELEEHQSSFSSEHRWKTVVGDLLTPDYEATINFLVQKSQEIQDDSISYTKQFLSEYNHKMFFQVNQPLRKEMKVAIESLFNNFTSLREKKERTGSFNTLIKKILKDEPGREGKEGSQR